MMRDLLTHPNNNKYMNEDQSEFEPAKSTKTQLLAHYKSIHEMLMQGMR